jgi:hypothetical protein
MERPNTSSQGKHWFEDMDQATMLKHFAHEGITYIMVKNIPIRFSPIVVLNLLFASDVVKNDPQIRAMIDAHGKREDTVESCGLLGGSKDGLALNDLEQKTKDMLRDFVMKDSFGWDDFI